MQNNELRLVWLSQRLEVGQGFMHLKVEDFEVWRERQGYVDPREVGSTQRQQANREAELDEVV